MRRRVGSAHRVLVVDEPILVAAATTPRRRPVFPGAQKKAEIDGKAPGRISVEAGLMEMLNRMQTGRWKVFHLNDWLEEFRLYHRKDGKVVKEHDDLLCASRYALMMKRFAQSPSTRKQFYAKIEYPDRVFV